MRQHAEVAQAHQTLNTLFRKGGPVHAETVTVTAPPVGMLIVLVLVIELDEDDISE